MKIMHLTSLLLSQATCASAFTLLKSTHTRQPQLRTPSTLFDSDAIDVEFVRADDDGSDKTSAKKSLGDIPQSTLQASLNMVEPRLRIPIEFTDPLLKSFIPCNLAFILEHDGVEYSIGTPIHEQVVVFCENDDGASYFIDPDEDDNLELMEMAAAKFESINECKLIFQRTPRTLTVQGGLDKLIKGWKSEDRPKPIDVVDVSDDSEEDEFFDSFFKKEIGDDYRDKCLVEDAAIDKEAQDMMEAFSVAGFGDRKDDVEGLENIVGEIEKDYKISQQDRSTWDNDGTETALRLVGFEGPDGKPYSLVKMLQPVILVAKDDDDLAPDQRFLLSKQEADQIIPILEQEFKAELAEAGLSTAPKYENPGFE
jgi:hypothetical protein